MRGRKKPRINSMPERLSDSRNRKALLKGVNTYRRKLTRKGVTEAFGMKYEDLAL